MLGAGGGGRATVVAAVPLPGSFATTTRSRWRDVGHWHAGTCQCPRSHAPRCPRPVPPFSFSPPPPSPARAPPPLLPPLLRSLASKLQGLSQDFRGMQKTYLDQLKKFKGGTGFENLIGSSGAGAGAGAGSGGMDETKEVDTVRRGLLCICMCVVCNCVCVVCECVWGQCACVHSPVRGAALCVCVGEGGGCVASAACACALRVPVPVLCAGREWSLHAPHQRAQPRCTWCLRGHGRPRVHVASRVTLVRVVCMLRGWALGARAPLQGFSNAQLMDLMSAEELAQERDQEIRKICQSIEELSVVFKELAALVIDQGTIIDRIDYNMEQVRDVCVWTLQASRGRAV